jgi:error-prone DNA polymerase
VTQPPTNQPPAATTLPPYAELFCLSNFSFLQGASHAEELVLRAVQLGYFALGIIFICRIPMAVRRRR